MWLGLETDGGVCQLGWGDPRHEILSAALARLCRGFFLLGGSYSTSSYSTHSLKDKKCYSPVDEIQTSTWVPAHKMNFKISFKFGSN
jgi:hypothetical protein